MSAWAVYLMLIIQARVRIYATLLSCVVTITTASPACCARGRFRLPLHLHPPSGSLGANQKNAFCGAIYIVPFETIILPRQARDTHTHTHTRARARKETLQKREWRFAQEGHSFQSIRDRCKATLKAAEGSSVCSREQWHEEQLTFTEVEFEWCAHRQAGNHPTNQPARQAGRQAGSQAARQPGSQAGRQVPVMRAAVACCVVTRVCVCFRLCVCVCTGSVSFMCKVRTTPSCTNGGGSQCRSCATCGGSCRPCPSSASPRSMRLQTAVRNPPFLSPIFTQYSNDQFTKKGSRKT